MHDITYSPTKRQRNLKRLLSPRHVAFVGGRSMVDAIEQCVAGGFSGAVWPVNPKYDELAGKRCYPSIDALPEAPDATFIAVPREATIEVVRDLAKCGAGGAVCYAAGFAEIGGDGVERQRELVEAAGDLAVVGPNCYGLLNYVDGVQMFASGPGGERVEQGAAFVAQSGNIALNATMNQRSVPFAYVISAGNQAVLQISDYVEVLADDPSVTAIGLYIEGLSDVPAFSRAAAKALERGIPIVALKAGQSELGAKLALSHTSSLAGDDKLYAALFERLGIVRVTSLPALLETLKLLSVAGLPTGDRLAIFTCSGGESLMSADRAAALGLALPELAPAQVAKLRTRLPDFATISNPFDYNTSVWGDRAACAACFGTVLAGDFDFGLLVIDYPMADPVGQVAYNAVIDGLIDASEQTGKRVGFCSTLPELLPESERRRAIAKGVAPIQGLDEALSAFAAAAVQACRRQELSAAGGVQAAVLPPRTAAPSDPRLLDEFDSKQRLVRYGLRVPEGRLASAAEAPAVAAALGFPVVAKLARPALAHKTEAGAVALNLRDAAAVADAVAAMTESVARYKPGLVAERFLIEKQVGSPVAELIVGVRRDEQFGLVLVVGAGGILVEMVEDAATLLLPTSRAIVERAIRGLRVAKLLAGYRGRPAGDKVAVVDAVMAVAAFAEAHRDRLVELDVNPLLVLPEGQGALAVDALVVMDGE
ncbi:acetate--CoA ligase family protein [Rhodospirillaceae bacterium SYSU D60014]|uniref:acetate--CoA ligase family protein n=1 Tax=Virgifigura deserti TaxID=2268457 RepID=UPI000E665FCB